MDRLASQGLRFTDAYSASAVCTPTRCAFITGRYPARSKIGLIEPLPATNHLVGLDPALPTIASLLKANGYDTSLIGKWHLGFRPEWGTKRAQERTFFWRIYNQDAVRQGKWKYLRNAARRQLFDLSVDQREQADFSTTQPQVLERLAAEFDKWNKQMLPRIIRET